MKCHRKPKFFNKGFLLLPGNPVSYKPLCTSIPTRPCKPGIHLSKLGCPTANGETRWIKTGGDKLSPPHFSTFLLFLLFYFSTFPLFYFSTLLLFYSSTFLLFYSSTFLLFYFSTFLVLWTENWRPFCFSEISECRIQDAVMKLPMSSGSAIITAAGR